MTRCLFTLLFLCTLLANTPIAAAEDTTRNKDSIKNRPRIGLVLKGGGALGLAHVGVLKVLERNHIPIDVIAGTSMGSIIGAAYASGSTVKDMEQVLSDTDWDVLFGEKVARPNLDYRLKSGRNRELFGDTKVSFQHGKYHMPLGVVEGQNIRLTFQKLFGNPPSPVDFDSLPIPFRAVTADVETGAIYVPERGDLATVVRASMSIPGAFSPVEIDGHLLVDGGIADNLPIDVALKMGADILIVVDLKCDLAKREELTSPLSMSGQMVSLLLMQNSTQSRKLVRAKDVVIEPNVSAYTITQFDKSNELIAIGEKAAETVVGQLKKLSLADKRYDQYYLNRTRRLAVPKTIDFIRINNNSKVSEGHIRELISTKAGDPFDPDKLEAAVQRTYQTGYFKSVKYSIVKEGDKSGVVVDTDGKEWLSQYIRLGFSLEDTLDGDNSFRLGAAFRTDEVGRKDSYLEAQAEIGKMPRFSLELYEPVVNNSPYFVAPKISIGRTPLEIRNGDITIAEYQRTEGFSTLAFGRRILTLGEASLGYTRGYGDLSRRIGDPSLPEAGYDIGDLYASLDLDTLDKPDFPTSGYRLSTRYSGAVESLGAPSNFQDLTGAAMLPLSFGRNTLVLKNEFSATFGDRPTERSYSLGGFLSVSGMPQNSLVASDYDTGGALFFHRFSEVQNPFFDLAFFAGGSFELTTIHNSDPRFRDYDLISSGSVLLGANTPLLPIYFSFGLNDLGENSIYITMGRIGRGK